MVDKSTKMSYYKSIVRNKREVIMKFNSLLAGVAFITLTACNTTGSISNASTNKFDKVAGNFTMPKAEVNVTMPKYFFTDEINKTCTMTQAPADFFSPPNKELDLTNEVTYKWLEDLKDYNWQEDHSKDHNNSLNVDFLELTDRTDFITTVLTNSIIDGTIEAQADKAIDLLVTWAKAEVIMDSDTIKDIFNKPKSEQKCYKGNSDVNAVCHWHTAQEAARYAGNVAIIANLARPYMNYTELTHVENYLNAMYDKYIVTWYNYSGSGNIKKIEWGNGFYQHGHGAIGMLAYAHWKNDKDIASYAFETAFKHIDYKVNEGGFINNNSFRGVRGYWYHSLGLNNMLGMVALAEEWNYPVEDKIYNKLTDAVQLLNQDAKEYLSFLESLDKVKNKHGNLYLVYNGKEYYGGNGSWDHKDARHHIHQHAKYLDHLANTYTKASLETDKVEYKLWKSKSKKELTDSMLGFNPTCITK